MKHILYIPLLSIGMLAGTATAATTSTTSNVNIQAVQNVQVVGATAAIIKDANPWGTTSNEILLTNMGVLYDVITSASLPAMNLSAYKMIIIASEQPAAFYTTITPALAPGGQIDAYIQAGGVLQFNTAENQANLVSYALPGGAAVSRVLDLTNNIVDLAHPITAGVPNPMTGNYASHEEFTVVPAGATVITAGATTGTPTTIEYCHGSGRVVATGTTGEIFYPAGDPGLLLANMVPYSYNVGGCAAPVPTPNYSIQFNTYSDCLNLWLDPVDGTTTGNIPVYGPGTVFSGLYDNQNSLGGGYTSAGGSYFYKFTVNSSTVDVYAVDPIGSTKTFITSDTWHVAPSCAGVMNNAPTSISAK